MIDIQSGPATPKIPTFIFPGVVCIMYGIPSPNTFPLSILVMFPNNHGKLHDFANFFVCYY